MIIRCLLTNNTLEPNFFQFFFQPLKSIPPVMKLPLIFFCENNLYGEGTPQHKQSPVADLSIRAEGYDLESMVLSYVTLFERVRREAACGVYRRPQGEVLPPPVLQAETSWLGTLPVPLRLAGRAGVRLLRRTPAPTRSERGSGTGS